MRPINNASVPLILLGGTLCDERLWQPVLEQLDVSDARRFTLQADDSSTAAAERLLAQLPPRFCLAGFSLGAIVATLLAGALPERIERLALIDGLFPLTHEPELAPAKLGEALRAHLQLGDKRKPVYASVDKAVSARLRGGYPLSREAAELLASRGLVPQAGGYTWRSDPRLTLPSLLRLTRAQAEAFVRAVRCPVGLVLAEQGLLRDPHWLALLEQLPFTVWRQPGGHHLHLDDEAGAAAVADCFKALFAEA